ncbi:phosphoinositide phosphatase SAC2-like isoform X3 [Silene latifolia]|uniref:phosphoinositide phosphatase SAC2-like isoform X3 n=1 Tax=Silene latifolia TaxID=37657 RepID=UPI003D784748
MNNGREGEVNVLKEMGSEIQVVDSRHGNDGVNRVLMEEVGGVGGGGELEAVTPYYLDKFTLFETPSHFYVIGRDKERLRWRVLKIGRLEPSELVIFEDPTIYSYPQCKLLLEDIHEVNKLSGGRKFVTNCYGIAGFVKFLGPYYILLITERKVIGKICGHTIYAISKYKMIPIPHSNGLSHTDNTERENRYKKLMWLVDIRKDFFFSYTYPIMQNLQTNLSQNDIRQSTDRKMFVWNEYLTRQIRNHLKNTLWTVALVHGFFKQVELSARGKNFLLSLIARRSCQFAGTRYQKRGVNDEGQAANDVEIEQIVSQEGNSDRPYKITSAVQNRGSIPVIWSQKPSLWNAKPEILFSERNLGYAATQLFVRKLRLRYGNPIILLNLLKSSGKNRREAVLGHEFHKAVDYINMNLNEEYRLNLLSMDLDAAFKTKDADVLKILKVDALSALRQIGLFSCQIPEPINFKTSRDVSHLWINGDSAFSKNSDYSDSYSVNATQKGILRTNCLDSLDRTNAAQYVYSLVALGHQLYELGLIESPELDFKDNLASKLMSLFEALGDAIAQQYGGSAAHSKVFAKTRGQCKASTVFQELFKSLQRHISNTFLDFDKQEAIDLFLGHCQPDGGQPAPQEINVVRKCTSQRRESMYTERASRSKLKRSQSDSEVHYEDSSVLGEQSEIASTDSDMSDYRDTASVSSVGLPTYIDKLWQGSLFNDAKEVESLGWNGSSKDYEEDPPDDRWLMLNSPDSLSSGGYSLSRNSSVRLLR